MKHKLIAEISGIMCLFFWVARVWDENPCAAAVANSDAEGGDPADSERECGHRLRSLPGIGSDERRLHGSYPSNRQLNEVFHRRPEAVFLPHPGLMTKTPT
ncbi:hypothetical protein SprV_0100382400 [Sparganum proliferum]